MGLSLRSVFNEEWQSNPYDMSIWASSGSLSTPQIRRGIVKDAMSSGRWREPPTLLYSVDFRDEKPRSFHECLSLGRCTTSSFGKLQRQKEIAVAR